MQELADAPSGDSIFSRLSSLLAEEDYDELETAWVEALDRDLSPEEISQLLDLVTSLIESGHRGRAGPLLELLLPAIAERAGKLSGQTLVRFQEVLARAFPENRDVFLSYCEAFQELNGPTTTERALFVACGLPETSQPAEALARLDRLRRYQVGKIVSHGSGWGMGEVLAIDPLRGKIRVDLERKKDHSISLEAVDSILEVLPDDSFRAMLHRGGEALRELAEKDPVALLHKCLDEFEGPVPQKNVKALLVPRVIEAKGWTRWWTAAKAAARESGYFRVEDRSPYRVERLDDELSFEDDLLRRFRGLEWKDVRQAALQVLRGGRDKFPGAIDVVVSELTEKLAAESDAELAFDLALLLLRQEDKEAARVAVTQTAVRFEPEEIARALEALPAGEDLSAAAELLCQARPEDWRIIAESAFLGKGDALRAAFCRHWEETDPESLKALVTEVFSAPRRSPEAYSWLLERRLREEERPATEPIAHRTPRGVLVLAADLLEHLVDREVREGRAAVKDLFRRVETLLWWDTGNMFREGVRIMKRDERLRLHARLVKSQEHLTQAAVKLIEILGSIEPVISRDDDKPIWENDNVILTTPEGLEHRRAEYREITDVKIPEIIKAIGIAREFGDLSENAEYTSALEERDNLTKRAKVIEEDLQKAALIDVGEIKAGVICVGSRIRIRNLDSNEETAYVILGPWDGGPDEGVLNYRSPLGRAFLGHKVGEEVICELPGGVKRFELLESVSSFD